MSTTANAPRRTTLTIGDRVDRLARGGRTDDLDEVGVALTTPVLSVSECRSLTALYEDVELFRSTVDMARHRFGQGQYRYFDHPLPDIVAELRAAFWSHLLPIARQWAQRRAQPAPWPDGFEDWLEHCHAAGQERPERWAGFANAATDL